jgi:hypothetical protein
VRYCRNAQEREMERLRYDHQVVRRLATRRVPMRTINTGAVAYKEACEPFVHELCCQSDESEELYDD